VKRGDPISPGNRSGQNPADRGTADLQPGPAAFAPFLALGAFFLEQACLFDALLRCTLDARCRNETVWTSLSGGSKTRIASRA
jgi:hypothetical protein